MNPKVPVNHQVKKSISGFFFVLLYFLASSFFSFGQASPEVLILQPAKVIHPFDEVTVFCPVEGTLTVFDGKGKSYFSTKASQQVLFHAGGAAGIQSVSISDKNGKVIDTATFRLEAPTAVNDGGKYSGLFDILYKGMTTSDEGEYSDYTWNNKSYKFYVTWDLDNSNVMNGMQYFLPYGNGLTDLFRETQRKDGMIWSFVNRSPNGYQYYETAYDPIGFFRKDKDAWFVRQPVDNHSDYNYVNMFYKHWKASGDNEWMKKTVASAALALDYCYTDSIRWSKRFQLLKRPYCIDSWDFQVDDEYTPEAPISPTMVVVPGKTKYGVFFGDNTGYFEACNQLAEMYDFAGKTGKAAIYRKRGQDILTNLTKLSWNGNFFTHFIDEDPTVKRNLGVDEKSQIAQGNMYSINRGLPHEMNVAIIKTYLKLKDNLPVGSPGEWYAIYPPFEKGFTLHDAKWQYMNGGIAGHAIGELAKGAYENGYETYGSDILNRLLELGKKYNNKIYFSYTGSIPLPPAAPVFRTVDISKQANMDLFDRGGKDAFTWMDVKNNSGNDIRNLPVGSQVFKNIPFRVIDPEKNERRAVLSVSTKPGFPQQLEVPVDDTAGAVYLLHSSSDNIPARVAGGITFLYTDGTYESKYIFKEETVTNWWFANLQNDRAGVAWSGPNLRSTKVGICWAAIDNPNPSKKIAKLRFSAPLEGGIYAVLAVSLADKPLYIKPKGESFGGPDNWAAADGMSALIEGLAGVKNTSLAYENVRLSPRWTSAGVDSVNVTANLAASNGYVSYQYKNNPEKKIISMLITGSGNEVSMHVLLPENVKTVQSVSANNSPLEFATSRMENSQYADFKLPLTSIQTVIINYQSNDK
ncbi:MAG: hypothetical protein WCI54_10285 [Bacteroidia bacterium]